jgi:hypothetical protein
VVAGRAHLAEGVSGLPLDDGVDRRQPGADGAARRFPGSGRDDRVAVDMGRMLERPGGDRSHLFEVRLRVRQQNLLLDVIAQRRFLADEPGEDLVRQHLVDGAHAVGALGMPGAGVVLDEGGMREEERRHGCACRVLFRDLRRHVNAPRRKGQRKWLEL